MKVYQLDIGTICWRIRAHWSLILMRQVMVGWTPLSCKVLVVSYIPCWTNTTSIIRLQQTDMSGARISDSETEGLLTACSNLSQLGHRERSYRAHCQLSFFSSKPWLCPFPLENEKYARNVNVSMKFRRSTGMSLNFAYRNRLNLSPLSVCRVAAGSVNYHPSLLADCGVIVLAIVSHTSVAISSPFLELQIIISYLISQLEAAF